MTPEERAERYVRHTIPRELSLEIRARLYKTLVCEFRAAVAEERESCARAAVDEEAVRQFSHCAEYSYWWEESPEHTLGCVAAAIRARTS